MQAAGRTQQPGGPPVAEARATRRRPSPSTPSARPNRTTGSPNCRKPSTVDDQPHQRGQHAERDRARAGAPRAVPVGLVAAQEPYRHARQRDADQVGEVRGGDHPDRVAGEQEDDGQYGRQHDRHVGCVVTIASADQARQQAVVGQLRQGARGAGQRLDRAVEHVEHHEPDRGALGRGPEQRRERRPDQVSETGGVGRSQSVRAEDAQPHDGQHQEVHAGHRGAGQHRARHRPGRIAHLADVAGRGLEGRRREADEVQPGHRAGDAAEHSVERGGQVPVEGLRAVHVAVQDRQDAAEQGERRRRRGDVLDQPGHPRRCPTGSSP